MQDKNELCALDKVYLCISWKNNGVVWLGPLEKQGQKVNEMLPAMAGLIGHRPVQTPWALLRGGAQGPLDFHSSCLKDNT